MRRSAVLAAAAALIAAAGVAHAGTIVSPPLWTDVNTRGACYVRNIGTKPITLQVTALDNFSPGFITPSFQNCNNAPLDAGRTCVLLVDDLPDDVTFACSADVSGSTKNIRAQVEVRNVASPNAVIGSALMK